MIEVMQPTSRRPDIQPIRARPYTNNTPLTPRQAMMPTAAVVTQQSTVRPARKFSVSPRLANLVLITIGILVIGGLGWWRNTDKPTLPSSVAHQLSFGVYFPASKIKDVSIDKRSISYQANGGRLSYRAQLTDGTTIDVNQQATPESFVDIPQAYDKLVASLQPYTSFDSINGKVSLTYPKELKGSQSAVMNAKGTLLFARPSKSLSDEQWRQLFNGLFAQQIPAAT